MSNYSCAETIYFDKNMKKWRGELRFTFHKEEKRKWFASDRKKDLLVKIAEYKAEIYRNENILLKDDISFEEFAMGWMEKTMITQIKLSSYYTKLRTLKNLVFPYIGTIPMKELKMDDVQSVIDALVKKGNSYSSIKKAYCAINGAARHYRVINKVKYDPCEGVNLPTALEKDVADYRFLNKKQRHLVEEEAYRRYANGALVYRYGPAIVLLMYSGMRFGELAGLTWEDIDFEERTIRINKTSVYIDMDGEHQYLDQETLKTKCSRRLLPMTTKAMEALLIMKEMSSRDDKFVMSTKNGKHPVPGSVNKTFRSILTNAGIIQKGEFRGVHMLRHTFATMLFENNCEVKIASELLGHTNTKVTENIYIHTIQEQRIKAINDLDKYCS